MRWEAPASFTRTLAVPCKKSAPMPLLMGMLSAKGIPLRVHSLNQGWKLQQSAGEKARPSAVAAFAPLDEWKVIPEAIWDRAASLCDAFQGDIGSLTQVTVLCAEDLTASILAEIRQLALPALGSW